jgi:hypothetical protein
MLQASHWSDGRLKGGSKEIDHEIELTTSIAQKYSERQEMMTRARRPKEPLHLTTRPSYKSEFGGLIQRI